MVLYVCAIGGTCIQGEEVSRAIEVAGVMKKVIFVVLLAFGVVAAVDAKPYACMSLGVSGEKMEIDIGSDDMTIKGVKFRFYNTEYIDGMQVHAYKNRDYEYVFARKMTQDDLPKLAREYLDRTILLATGSGIGMVRWGCYELDVKKKKA